MFARFRNQFLFSATKNPTRRRFFTSLSGSGLVFTGLQFRNNLFSNEQKRTPAFSEEKTKEKSLDTSKIDITTLTCEETFWDSQIIAYNNLTETAPNDAETKVRLAELRTATLQYTKEVASLSRDCEGSNTSIRRDEWEEMGKKRENLIKLRSELEPKTKNTQEESKQNTVTFKS